MIEVFQIHRPEFFFNIRPATVHPMISKDRKAGQCRSRGKDWHHSFNLLVQPASTVENVLPPE